jgi:fatty-acyl-CoA synthase
VTTATRWLHDLVMAHGDAVALIDPEGTTLTFAELEVRVASLAGGLQQYGLGRGDRLAAFVPNGLLPVELLLAAARLGAVTIGVNTRYRAADLRHLLDRSRPRLLVRADRFLELDFEGVVAGALDGLGIRPDVIVPGQVDELRSGSPINDDRARPDDLLVAFTTSGTTGRPKLAAHDHASTFRHLRAVAQSLEVSPDSVTLLALPICGTFGFVSLYSVLHGGGRVITPATFQAAQAATLIEEYGVTHFNASDDMILRMASVGGDLSSWRHGVFAEFTGRGLESVRAAEAFGARITGVYGSSETFAVLFRRPVTLPTVPRARNGGLPVDPAMEVRAVGGEIQLRGPAVLNGYLVEEGTAAPSLTADGWFPTGDLGTIDGDGGFTYLARLGDALRLAGFLTDPLEIEQYLLTHPGVTGAQVVGVPATERGEVAVAFVTVSGHVEEAELVAHCRRGLANYKVPTRILIVGAFPTVEGANGVKIRKTELREQAAVVLADAGGPINTAQPQRVGMGRAGQ